MLVWLRQTMGHMNYTRRMTNDYCVAWSLIWENPTFMEDVEVGLYLMLIEFKDVDSIHELNH